MQSLLSKGNLPTQVRWVQDCRIKAQRCRIARRTKWTITKALHMRRHSYDNAKRWRKKTGLLDSTPLCTWPHTSERRHRGLRTIWRTRATQWITSRLKFKICHLSRCWPSLRSTLNTRTYSQAIKRPSMLLRCWISASRISSLSSSRVSDFRRTTKSQLIRNKTRLTQTMSNTSLMTKASSIKTLWRTLWRLWRMARSYTATISRTHLSSASTILTKSSFRGTTASSEITRRVKRKTT